MTKLVNNFTVIESVYGRFVINRRCGFQAEYLIKTGDPHIESELRNMLAMVKTLPADSIAVDAGANNIGPVSVPSRAQSRAHAASCKRLKWSA